MLITELLSSVAANWTNWSFYLVALMTLSMFSKTMLSSWLLQRVELSKAFIWWHWWPPPCWICRAGLLTVKASWTNLNFYLGALMTSSMLSMAELSSWLLKGAELTEAFTWWHWRPPSLSVWQSLASDCCSELNYLKLLSGDIDDLLHVEFAELGSW
jgi:hypothetical protein